MNLHDILYLLNQALLPLISIVLIILGIIFLFRGKLGKLDFSTVAYEANEIKNRLQASDSNNTDVNHQYALLQEYHAQGLAQSKISFWFSLVFGAIGFFIIIISVLSYNFSSGLENKTTLYDQAAKPIFAVVAGTIIDAVAALFFVQSNKARQLMTEFFDKLRIDRKLDASLHVLSQIEDEAISSRVKALLTLNFAEVNVSDDAFRRIVSGMPVDPEQKPSNQVKKDTAR